MRAAGSWCSATSTTGSWSCSNPPSRASWSATRRPRTPRWVRWCPSRTGTRWPSYVPDDAPVAFRGDAPSGPGYWFPPTVLTPARTDRTVTEEIFGPVVTVLPFDDEADAIALANDTDLRPVRVDLDRQPVAGAAGVARGGSGQPVGQLALVGALQHAVRRVQAVRPRPRARPRRAAVTSPKPRTSSSRSEKPDGSDPATGGQGRRHHRRRQRHRAGDRQADAGRGRDDRHRRHRPGHGQGRRRRTRRTRSSRSTSRTRSRSTRCSTPPPRPTARSTSRSTTRASARPRTT